jgi:hypothetical protein
VKETRKEKGKKRKEKKENKNRTMDMAQSPKFEAKRTARGYAPRAKAPQRAAHRNLLPWWLSLEKKL